MSIKKKSYRLACHNKYLPIMMFFRSVIEEKIDGKKNVIVFCTNIC